MKYVYASLLALLVFAAYAEKLPYGQQSFSVSSICEEVIKKHNSQKASNEFRKIGLIAESNKEGSCIVITLDDTAPNEKEAIERFKKAYLRGRHDWTIEDPKSDMPNFWRLVAK